MREYVFPWQETLAPCRGLLQQPLLGSEAEYLWPSGTTFLPLPKEERVTLPQPLENVLGTFWHLAYMADEIVVQNWDFELTILRSAFARIGHSGKVALFLERVVRDTTVMGRILFPELPLSGHGRGPSLSRMWQHVFGVPRAKGTHRARRDDQDLRTLFLALEAIQCGRATVEDFRNAARIGDPGAGTPDADREGSASGEAPASTASTSQP